METEEWFRTSSTTQASTHDLALGEIATIADLCGENVHMGSRDGADPLDFDYLLKPGLSRESNTMAIMRMAGMSI